MNLDTASWETDAFREQAWPFAIPAGDLRELTDRLPIDLRAFQEHCMGNTAFALTLLDEFTRTAYERMTSLRNAADRGALPELADMAHALKGVAGVFSAGKLCELCDHLTARTARGDLSQSRYVIQCLCDEIRRCQDYISSIRPELNQRR